MWILIFFLIGPIITKTLVADKTTCPYILDDPLPAHLPYGMQHNLTGIKFQTTEHTTFEACVTNCCGDPGCNAAMLVSQADQSSCVFITCENDQLCLPAQEFSDLDFNTGTLSTVNLVLVHPNTPPWPNIKVDEDVICEVGLDATSCPPNQHCRPLNEKSKNGICRCTAGMFTTKDGCVSASTELPTTTVTTTTKRPEPVKINVKVANRTLELPISKTSLTAYTNPTPEDLTFDWKLVSFNLANDQNKFQGVESNSNSATLQLEDLAEGIYIYRVHVNSQSLPGEGEAVANITVLPVPRVNTPPVAVIKPPNQTVTLPTNKAVLEGSQSKDDTGGLEYTWSIASGPVGYDPELPSVPTLTLSNLIAGNYTIKLTVKDAEGLIDTTTSSLTVLKENDYPPTAIAGEDKIVFLPQNKVVLNGNQSSDDHEIVTWEWTKLKSDDSAELPADITGARTPYLTVGNLEQGIYNFLLKVTDSGGQSSTDQVAVYVKAPLNVPPKSNAGQDDEYSLPLAYITLQGSGETSTSNNKITAYQWSQLSGPKSLNISKPARPATNVTGLVAGKFVFQLMVIDNIGNNGTDTVTIVINEDRNQAPVAVIKKPGLLEHPVSVLYLDGSESSDDLAIEKWEWWRNENSLAAGKTVGSRNTSVLTLVDLVPGVYSFSLKVSDGQGKSNTTTVSFTIGGGDNARMAEVELVISQNFSTLKQSQLRSILDAIKVLTKSKSEVEIVKIYPARRTGLASLIFKVMEDAVKSKYMSGMEVVAALQQSLASSPDLLQASVHSLETVLCQNTCGGHGTCNPETRECICDPFWMQNIFSRAILKSEPNCNWSVIYVAVIMFGGVFTTCLLCCLTRGFSRSRLKYNRLNTGENVELAGRGELLSSTTDTEEEEILYEAAKKKKYTKKQPRRQTNGTTSKLKKSSRDETFA